MESELIEDFSFKQDLIRCFRSDEMLLSKWHIYSGRGLDACVDKTYMDLLDLKVQFFRLVKRDVLAGYFARETYGSQEFLTGFFLMPCLRNKNDRELFWKAIKMRFSSTFGCGLYEKNIPAKKFIQSRGGIEVRKVSLKDGDAVLYRLGV